MGTVLTYGTFDVLHFGHIRLLQRARLLGDALIVGLSSDDFNVQKGKRSFHSWEERKANLRELRCVDLVVLEDSWDQKISDIERYSVDTFVMGGDWVGRFDYLQKFCNVLYLERTETVSSSLIRDLLKPELGVR